MKFRGAVALLAVVAILLAAAAPGLFLAILVSAPLPVALIVERRRESKDRRPRWFAFLSPRASRAPPLFA